jgi:hypothetical protein
MLDRSIAPKFKEDMLWSYALKRSAVAKQENYSKFQAPKVLCENHFSNEDGIGYFKVSNNGNRPVEITMKFALSLTIKVIKPNTNDWKLLLKTKE